MIELDRVSKRFGVHQALDDVSFDVGRGEALALLGHNGAGKSTLFAIVLGLRRATAGDVRVSGISVRADPRGARRRIGSVLAPAFYEYLSGWDNLRVITAYSGAITHAELRAAVRFVGLDERIHDRVGAYSHGMRRRLALAQALVPRPDVLLLDEWEAGLDPEGIAQMRALLRRLNREDGITLLVSSHRPSGVDELCERVAILRRGRLAFVGRWSELDDGAPVVRLDVDDLARARAVAARLGTAIDADGCVALGAGVDAADLVAALVQDGVRVRAVEPLRLSAEDRYLRAVAAAGERAERATP